MKWNWTRKNRRRGEAMTADLAAAMSALASALWILWPLWLLATALLIGLWILFFA